jgi:hypothetical protein
MIYTSEVGEAGAAYLKELVGFPARQCEQRGDEGLPATFRYHEIFERMLKASPIYAAALALYGAGRWSCDRPVDEGALWVALRDGLGLQPGTATAAGMGNAQVTANPICNAWFRLGAMTMRDDIYARLTGLASDRDEAGRPAAATEVIRQSAGIALEVPLPKPTERAYAPPGGDWAWYAGSNEEWYQVGPCRTREDAVEQGRAMLGPDCRLFLIEGYAAALTISAEPLLLHWMENEAQDGFDAEHRECDRIGGADEINAADEELQELLTAWLGRWGNTFTRPNLFAETRNAEVLPALEAAA